MKTIWGIALGVLLGGCATMDTGSRATAKLEPRSGSQVRGTVNFVQVGDTVRVTGEVTGHVKGSRGFHIHEKGDCSDPKAMSTGGHFNPRSHQHGAPTSAVRHAGDLGNLAFDDNGVAKFDFTIGGISVSRDRPDGIVGRAVIVHMDQDDLKTDPTGNAGGRVACGVIRD